MGDAMNLVTNPSLVSAIEKAREDSTAEAWADMVRAAEKARFITPVDISPLPAGGEGEARILKGNTSFSLHVLEDPESRLKYYMAFTDWEELGKWRAKPGQRVLILTFEDYARLVLDGKMNMGGFIINPYGGNVMIGRAMIEAVRHEQQGGAERGPEKIVMEKGTTICLGEPETYPEALIQAVSGYLKTQPGVTEAYLQQMEKDGDPSYLIALRFAGDRQALFEGISHAAGGLLSDLPLNLASCDTEFWRDTAEGLEPFYRRADPEPRA
jgi:hypothetical protein